LANGLFFGPRRHIHFSFVEPDDLPRQGNRQTINRYLETFYNQDAPPAHYVPYTWWDRGGARVLTPRTHDKACGTDVTVSPALRKQVLAFLQERTGVTDIQDSMSLTRDLGMDSLAGAELVSWLETEYGQTEMPIDALRNVRDVLLAAQGEAVVVGEEEVIRAPRRWLRQGPAPQCPEHLAEQSITEAFLYQARRAPHRVVIADSLTGIRTYRDMVLAITLLRRELESLPGVYLGIMLPASAGVAILYLAALFAGKVPVMVNWTLGKRNLTHALDSLDVTCVVTARTLLTKLSTQGVDLGDMLDRFLCVEDLRDRFTFWDKLRAKAASYGTWRYLVTATPPATAAVLFTSGSENVPKAVPLTHRNMLTNVQDAFNCLTLTEHDSLLGVLPPFHSFGLTVSLVLPLTLGVRIFFYPNPMHGGMLGRLIDVYQLSVLVGTPTFLHGIVRVTSPRRLQPLRLVVSGAEKCPARVYDLLAERCPTVKVMEGYGITECAPVVSVNRQWQIRHGTIGKPLAAVEHAIVDVACTQRVALGTPGLLLVRGDSIFDGYLNYEGPSPFTTFEGECWYHTGDLVCEDEQGVLTFCGRLRRFIKVGGEMISLPAIESVLQQHFDDPEADGPALAVVATPREENPDIVLFSVPGVTREAANRVLREAGLSGLHFIRLVRSIDTLPLLGTGKTDYQALAALLR
jgi:long-chain-fatty-acid--[acyl-carrier-protein] ligase